MVCRPALGAARAAPLPPHCSLSPPGPLTAAASSASTDMPSFGAGQPLEARLTARGQRPLQRARSRRTSLERTPLAPVTDLFTAFYSLSWIEKERDFEALGEPVYTRDGHWEGWKVWFGNLDPRTTEVTMRQWLSRELRWIYDNHCRDVNVQGGRSASGDCYAVVTWDTATHAHLCVRALYGRFGRPTHTGAMVGIKVQYWIVGVTVPAATDEIGLATAADTGPVTEIPLVE